jgi:hypothetical protein
MPNGTVAPGNRWPSPPVPMRGSTSSACWPPGAAAALAAGTLNDPASTKSEEQSRKRFIGAQIRGEGILDRSKWRKLTPADVVRMLHCVIANVPFQVNLDRSKSKDRAQSLSLWSTRPAPGAVCAQGKEDRAKCMSIHKREMTQPCGQTDSARRVAVEWPPGASARLDQPASLALRHALAPGGHSTATRATWIIRTNS